MISFLITRSPLILMTQLKPRPQKTEETALSTVPMKTQRRTFLDLLRMEFTQVSNRGGDVTRAGFGLNLRPVTVDISVGSLRVNYFSGEPMFFVSSRVGLDHARGRWERFGNAAIAVVPHVPSPGGETRSSVSKTVSLGATYDVIPQTRRSRFGLRLGFDVSGSWESGGLGGFRQGIFNVGVGSSVSYDPLTLYATGRFFINTSRATEEYWTDIRLHYMQAKAGLVLFGVLDRTDIGAEVSHSTFEKGGRVFASLGRLVLEPQVYFSYNDVAPIFGNAQEFILGFQVPFGRRGRDIGRLRVEQGVGGEQVSQFVSNDINTSVVVFALQMPSSMAAARQMTTDQAEQAQTRLWQIIVNRYKGKTPELDYAGVDESDAGVSPEALARFRDTLTNSMTFDQFAQSYQGASLQERLNVAMYLAGVASLFYDRDLLDASAFSSRKKDEVALQPSVVYDNVRRALASGERLSAGVCTNINGMATEFLRRTGVEAYTIGISGMETVHLVGVARDSTTNTNYIIDYATKTRATGRGIWPVIQAYARTRGLLVDGIYLYGNNNEIIGFYRGPESRLLETVAGTEEDLLRRSLIRRRE